MNDFTILHLSDLHINGQGVLSRLMKNLLSDIESEMRDVENIILVVTGDILDKAQYDDYEDNVVQFFTQLKNILGNKLKDAYFVPGNHDREHKVLDDIALTAYSEQNSDEFKNNYWKYIQIGYDKYLKLVNRLYAILKIEQKDNNTYENTYGVKVSNINNKRICFLLFDTAWSSKGGIQDERSLKIGRFQMHDILKEYEAVRKEKPFDMVIALAHHPLEWLDGIEENMFQAELLSKNRLGANVYISGHIHNRDVINWQNNRHSMTTLVSGIGWPDGNESHPYPHVYSSYTFNLDLNSIDVYVRSSNEDNCFNPDFRIYTKEHDAMRKKIVMPINVIETQSFFELGTVVGRSAKVCYITDSIIDSISEIMHQIWNYRKHMQLRLEHIKYDYIISEYAQLEQMPKNRLSKRKRWYLQKLNDFFFNGCAIEAEHPVIYEEYKNGIYRYFETYLAEICDILSRILSNQIDNRRIRTHFRIWNTNKKENIEYCPLVLADTENEHPELNTRGWSELLARAYEAERPLVASVNEQYCKESFTNNAGKKNDKNKWTDFLTAIPIFEGNRYNEIDALTKKEIISLPYLTFGITIYNEEDKRLLYILDYFRIDEIIGDVIKDFLFYFPISIQGFVNNKLKKKENLK